MNDELDVHHHGAQWSHPSAPSSPIGIVLVKPQAFLLPTKNPCMYCWSHLRSRAKCGFEKNSYLLYITQYNSIYELGLLCLESEVKINFCPSILLLIPLYKDSTPPPIHSWALSSDLPPQYLDAADGGHWTGFFFESEHSASWFTNKGVLRILLTLLKPHCIATIFHLAWPKAAAATCPIKLLPCLAPEWKEFKTQDRINFFNLFHCICQCAGAPPFYDSESSPGV